jgi:hypothetical protein
MPLLFTFIILFIQSAILQAKQQAIDLTICIAGTCDHLSDAEDMRTMSCQSRGIGWSNNDYEQLETFITFGRCVLGIKNDEWDIGCFTKYLDSDGDYIIFRKNKIYGGTGKWKGVTGNYQDKWIRSGKSLPTGNFANCQIVTGAFELPE